MSHPLPQTKILFDGNCLVCDTEISRYKKLAPEIFELVDISNPNFDAARWGLTPAAVQKHMHVFTPDGTLLKGVDAFAHIWGRLPGFKLASKIIHLPIIYATAKLGYRAFASVRRFLPKKL